jgi:hypothetical protein
MSANTEPPVIVVGGSLTINLNQNDFPNAPRELKCGVRVTSIEIVDENGQTHKFDFPNGKFKITFRRG